MRVTLTTLGVLVLILAWTFFPGFARSAFYGHMIMHMLVVAVAAPVIALGFTGTSFDLSLKYPGIFSPIPSSVGELIIVWAWHAPFLHHYARHTSSGLILEQGTFILSGLWVWMSCLGGKNFSNRGAGVIGLLLTSMHMTFLGALLSLSQRPLYGHHEAPSGLTVLQDQHLGGAIMLVVGGISYLSGGLWLTVKILKHKMGRVNEGVV